MQFVRAQSNTKPEEEQAICGKRFYIRKNITEEIYEDSNGEKHSRWVYDEALVNEIEYTVYVTLKQFNMI